MTIPASGSLDWLTSDAALIVLGVATVIEIGGYYIPWVDNLLDTIATPSAGIAGSAMMIGLLGDAPDVIQWGLGIIGGGGTALGVQALTVVTRGASTIATAGLGNPVVSTVENAGASVLAIGAALVGPLVLVGVVLGVFVLLRKLASLRATTAESPASLVDGRVTPEGLPVMKHRKAGRSPMMRSKRAFTTR